MKKISIVIPVWNGAEKIKKHLPKVLEIAKDNNVWEVIISDDASTDNSVEILKKQFLEVIVVERKHNQGFASNVNSGVNKATGELVFLLNSDAEPKKDTIKFALPHFENPQVFSVGCNVGGLWAIGYFKDGFFWHGQGQLKPGETPSFHQTLWASGGSSFFNKSIWDELGGLDTLYDPFYVEDVDLGFRATKRGYLNIWEPKAEVEHYQEKGVIESNFSKNLINNTAERNILIFIWKDITSSKLLSEHKKALIKRLIKHPKYWPIFLSALSKYPQIMAKRKIEEKFTKLTDEEIFSIFRSS